MADTLFTIRCPTCLARIRVTRPEAVGAILPCPKCGSLVPVIAPEGWVPPTPNENSPGSHSQDFSASPPTSSASETRIAKPSDRVASVEEASCIQQLGTSEELTGHKDPASPPTRETQPPEAAAATAQITAQAVADSTSQVPNSASVEPTDGPAMEAENCSKRRWPLLAVIAVTLLIIVALLAIRGLYRPPNSPQVEQEPITPAERAAAPPKPAVQELEDTLRKLLSQQIDQAIWLDVEKLQDPKTLEPFAKATGLASFLAWAERVRQSLGLLPEGISTIVIGGQKQIPKIAVLTLRQGQRAEQLNHLGVEFYQVDGLSVRRLVGDDGDIVFAVVGPQELLVGEWELVKAVLDVTATSDETTDIPWQEAVASLSSAVAAAAFRQGSRGQVVPHWWLSPWPQLLTLLQQLEKNSSPVSAALVARESNIELVGTIFCGSAEGKAGLGDELKSLREHALSWLEVQTQQAPPVGTFLAEIDAAEWHNLCNHLAESLNASTVSEQDNRIELRLPLGPAESWNDAVGQIVAGLDAVWKVAMSGLARERGQKLGESLGQFHRRHDRFPVAVMGGQLLPPETRLSWIAELVPYLGYPEWAQRLQTGYSWNAPQNRDITQQYLPEVTNPLVGPTQTQIGFYDTHVVGVTGIGADAGDLPPTDPRAGLFNFRRPVSQQEVRDGLSQTLALLPVVKHRGPWAAGGRASARALTTPPYVNGADGFGSGQPHGMLAVMADGAVRFIHRDVDARVLEQMATIAGGEPLNLDLLAPRLEGTLEGLTRNRPAPEAAGGNATPPSLSWPGDRVCGSLLSDPQVAQTAESADASSKTQVTVMAWPPLPLGLALTRLTQWTGRPVTIDPESLLWTGLSADRAIEIKTGRWSFQEIYRDIASQFGLEIVLCDDVAVLCAPERLKSTISFRLKDIRQDLPSALLPSLQQVMNRLVANSEENPIKLEAHEGEVTLEGPFVFVQILRNFFENTPVPVSLSEQSLDQELSQVRVSLNYFEPTPLIQVIAQLNRLQPCQILFDWPTLKAMNITPETSLSLTSADEPLPTVLRRLAEMLDLDIYVLNPRSLLLSSADRFEKPALLLYNFDGLIKSGMTANILCETITTKIAPESWRDKGGIGQILLLSDGRQALILQKPSIHREIAGFLAGLGDSQ